MRSSEEQHRLWTALFRNQVPNVERYACREYLEGFARLNLPEERLPTLAYLNSRITPRTGWRTVRTAVRYSDSRPWYEHFARQEFLITDYLRSWAEFEFTPEPDMFHDLFGHLPFMTDRRYTGLLDMFANAYLRADQQQNAEIERLAWFSYEFGLIEEEGGLRVFGAGILSSAAETLHVMAGHTPLKPFTIENVLRRNKAIDSFNRELFVFHSLDELKDELGSYFRAIEGSDQPAAIDVREPIVDREMDLGKYRQG